MNIFVISMRDSIERRKKIVKQLTEFNLQFEFIDGVAGKDHYNDPTYYNEKKSLKYEKRQLLPGEIGCAASHIAAYSKIIEQKLPYAFIIEDDAIISPDVPAILQILEKHIAPNDLITLEKCDIYSKKNMIPLFNDYKLVKPQMIKYGSMCQTAGYIITTEAAKKIADINMPVFIPADSWGNYRKIIRFRGVIPSKALIRQDMDIESTIVTGIRPTNSKSTIASLLFYDFYTQFFLGRVLKEIYKFIFKRNKKT